MRGTLSAACGWYSR